MHVFLIATDDTLLVVQRRGDEWRSRVAREITAPRCLAADPHHPGRFYCGTEDAGLWRSEDAGRTWHPVGAGIEQTQITAVGTSPHELDGSVYVGTEPSRMYRSRDGGDSWTLLAGLTELPSSSEWAFPPRPWTHHVRWIEPHPTEAGPLYVAIEAGALVRSPDSGNSWQDRRSGSPYDTHTLATHPQAPKLVRSAAGDGYFESRDGGDNWQRPREGLRHGYLVGLAVAPADPDIVLVSAAASPRSAYNAQAADSYLYRKVGDDPWQHVREGLPAPRRMTINIPATHPTEPNTFYSANNHGLFRSRNSGESWEHVGVEWPEALRRQRVHALTVVEVT